MFRRIGMFAIALALAVPSLALAGSEAGAILLTSGTVKRVDLDKGIVVLDSGRIVAVRTVQRDGRRVELREIKLEDDVFVSGNTSRGRPEQFNGKTSSGAAKLLFASSYWAFAVLEVGDDGYEVTFIDEKNRRIYCCQARGRGMCEPVACMTSSPR